MILRKTAYQKAGIAYKRNSIATLLVGLVFLFIGIASMIMKDNYDMSFTAILGLVFLSWPYFSYRSGEQIQASDEKV